MTPMLENSTQVKEKHESKNRYGKNPSSQETIKTS